MSSTSPAVVRRRILCRLCRRTRRWAEEYERRTVRAHDDARVLGEGGEQVECAAAAVQVDGTVVVWGEQHSGIA